MFRIQNDNGCGRSYTNSIPDSLGSFSRFISPTARSWASSAISIRKDIDPKSPLTATRSGVHVSALAPPLAKAVTQKAATSALAVVDSVVPSVDFGSHLAAFTIDDPNANRFACEQISETAPAQNLDMEEDIVT